MSRDATLAKRILAVLLLIFTTGANTRAWAQPEQTGLLRLRVAPVCLAQKSVPLSTALEQIGIHLQGGYVLFGIEIRLTAGKEPTVDLDIPSSSTLEDALKRVFRQLPLYKYEVAGKNLINVYPVNAKTEPQNLLNICVPRFDIEEEQASDVLGAPQLFVRELQQRLTPPPAKGPPQPSGSAGPRMRGTLPPITIHLGNVTVREILNAVSVATQKFPPQYLPLGWVYYFQDGTSLPRAAKHRWKVHSSVPSTWKPKELVSVPHR